MRVLHVVSALDRGSGTATAATHLRHPGHNVEAFVVALDAGAPLEAGAAAMAPFAGNAAIDSAHTFALEPVRGPRLVRAGWRVARLARLLRRQRISVVHAHGPRAGAIAAAAATWAGIAATVRTEYRFARPGGWMLEPIEIAGVHATRWIACTCEAVRRVHAVRWPWAADRFVTVFPGLPAATPRPRAAARAELALEDRDAVVLLPLGGALGASASVMLDAFFRISRRAPHARLVVAGDGAARPALERRVAELGLDGWVRWPNPATTGFADLVEAADVVALPSSREGVPLALIEAMRGGVAVVAPRAGGVPELVADGETGWLVPPADPATSAEALMHVLIDRPRARAFGAAARDCWTQRFGVERMIAETEQLYRAAVAESRRARVRPAAAEAAA